MFVVALKEILSSNIIYPAIDIKNNQKLIPLTIQMISNRNLTKNDEFVKYSWLDKHLSHRFVRYTSIDLDRLVLTQLPFMYEFYSSLSKSQKLDVGRYVILYENGGIYVEDNILAVRSHHGVHKWSGLVVPLLPEKQGDKKDYWDVSNAWLASQPRHPFILFLLQSFIEDWEAEREFGGVRYFRQCLLEFELQRIPSDPAIHYLDYSIG